MIYMQCMRFTRVILTTFSKKCSLVLVNLSRTRLHWADQAIFFTQLHFHCISVEQYCIYKLDFHSEWVFLNDTRVEKEVNMTIKMKLQCRQRNRLTFLSGKHWLALSSRVTISNKKCSLASYFLGFHRPCLVPHGPKLKPVAHLKSPLIDATDQDQQMFTCLAWIWSKYTRSEKFSLKSVHAVALFQALFITMLRSSQE